MSMITIACCKSAENSTMECNLKRKNSPPSNCPDSARSQVLGADCPCTEDANAAEVTENPLQENEVIYKNSRLARSSRRMPFEGTAKTRNAYVNFVNEYRKDHKNLLPWQVMSQAASCWKRLSQDEKSRYKTDAQNAKYSYKSKNKTLNKVLATLRRSVASKPINVNEVVKASRQIQLWKEEVLKGIESDRMV